MKNATAMKSRLAAWLGLLFFACSSCYSGTVPAVDQILTQVQDHVREFEFSLPDFTCDETITSSGGMNEKIGPSTVVNSVFRGIQSKDENGRPFIESREIKAINGVQVGKGQPLKLSFFFGGGFSSVLDATFGPNNIQYHDYKIVGTEKINGRTSIVVKFATKADQKGLFFEFMGGTFLSKDTGRAWIDQESMQVMRLERRYVNVPSPYGVMDVSVDYAEVVINEKTFWMPKTVKVEETLPDSQKPMSVHYIAEYSNYEKFNVSVQIKY